MGNLGDLLGDFVRWLVNFSPWCVRIRSTHRAILFVHRRYFRLMPKCVLRRLPRPVGKWVVGHLPFCTRSRTICRTIPLSPGWWVYWPKHSELEVIPVKRQTLTTKNQAIEINNINLSVQAQVIYEVEDTQLTCCHTYDYLETIGDIAQLAVVLVIASHGPEEFKRTWYTRQVRSEFTRRVRKELRPFGLYVLRAFFSQCSSVRVIRLLSDAPISGSFTDGSASQGKA
jgi:hypothetical protein